MFNMYFCCFHNAVSKLPIAINFSISYWDPIRIFLDIRKNGMLNIFVTTCNAQNQFLSQLAMESEFGEKRLVPPALGYPHDLQLVMKNPTSYQRSLVLLSSPKIPVRDPFRELLQGSWQD